MSGTFATFEWHGRKAKAWVPAELAVRDLSLDKRTIATAAEAVDRLRSADTLVQPGWEPLARLMLRTEGIASSSIEGVRASVDDVARAELDHSKDMSVGWIVDNLRAVEAALLTSDLSVEALDDWHRSLMGHSPLPPEMIGSFRDAPSWIGGTSPLDAAFVPPPAALVPELMDDLIAFANDTPCDAVSHAAILHAQFETIHPYGDGNGRLGRALVGWVLRRRQIIRNYPPPISVLMARDAGGYISGLHLFREDGLNHWVKWFASIASSSGKQSHAIFEQVEKVLLDWEGQTAHLRVDAAARRAVALLPQMPVVNAKHLGDALQVSSRAAFEALRVLDDLGILSPHNVEPAGPGRPQQWFSANGLLDAARTWT